MKFLALIFASALALGAHASMFLPEWGNIMSAPDRLQVLKWWQTADYKSPAEAQQYKALAAKAMAYRAEFYDPVTAALGMPWYLVAALDMREENFNHKAYLGNGDPLSLPTRHVPRGRGPFKTWNDGAVDALTLDGMNTPAAGNGQHWDIVTVLIACEKFNGFGYTNLGLPSPYVWSGTTVQRPGKFTGDGQWDPNTWDTQPGCAPLFEALKQLYGVDLNEK